MYLSLKYDTVIGKIKEYSDNLKNTRYNFDEKILANIIPKHKQDYLDSNLEYVYYISTLINSFYSTRMGNDRLFIVAKYISEHKNIDSLEKITQLIEEANNTPFKIKNKKNEIKYFKANSFLSKYYAIHNRILFNNNKYSKYAILDSTVKKCIKEIIDNLNNKNSNYSKEFQTKFKQYKKKDIDDYTKLNEMLTIICNEINKSRTSNNREMITFTHLDRYFWGRYK